jgi:signal transduction histidine kinase
MSLKQTNPVRVSFSFRLALLYTSFLALSFILLFGTTYQLVHHIVRMRDRDVIRAQTSELRALYSQGGVRALANYFSQPINPSEPVFVRIVDRKNQVRFITASHPLWSLLDRRMQQGKSIKEGTSRWDELAKEESEGSWMVATIPLNGDYLLQVGRSNTETKQVLAHFRRMAWRIFLPALLLSLLGGWFATHSILTPLRALVKTIRQILETGNFKQRVPDQVQRGELGNLTILFNRVLDRNEELVQASRDTLDNVAHDLRTPMTHLRNAAEHALQMAEPDPDVQREALADCMEESEKILRMLNVLMELAEADTGVMRLSFESVALHELVDETIELYSIVAEDREVTLQNEVPPDLMVSADRLRMRQCLSNLIDNALKYSDEGALVTVGGRATDAGIEFWVIDQGCGIGANDLGPIWDRLYRAERSRATPGLGLGLSMVKAIAEAHGGSVAVTSSLDEGSTFMIRLPHKLRLLEGE